MRWLGILVLKLFIDVINVLNSINKKMYMLRKKKCNLVVYIFAKNYSMGIIWEDINFCMENGEFSVGNVDGEISAGNEDEENG